MHSFLRHSVWPSARICWGLFSLRHAPALGLRRRGSCEPQLSLTGLLAKKALFFSVLREGTLHATGTTILCLLELYGFAFSQLKSDV